jgi:hypothetical protein
MWENNILFILGFGLDQIKYALNAKTLYSFLCGSIVG